MSAEVMNILTMITATATAYALVTMLVAMTSRDVGRTIKWGWVFIVLTAVNTGLLLAVVRA